MFTPIELDDEPVNLEGILEISRCGFRDDKKGVGPSALFHFEYFTMTRWALAPVHFHVDKMDVGPRTLFHFGSFAMTSGSFAMTRRIIPGHFTTTTNTHYGT